MPLSKEETVTTGVLCFNEEMYIRSMGSLRAVAGAEVRVLVLIEEHICILELMGLEFFFFVIRLVVVVVWGRITRLCSFLLHWLLFIMTQTQEKFQKSII
jgi:hypothetical protein